MRVAVDAMGGDHAPLEVVRGAIRALTEEAELNVVLVGREAEIRVEIEAAKAEAEFPAVGERLSIVHAEQVVGCDENPLEALRKKKDNSIVKSFGLVAEGHADAVVSAGNTGAVVGAATLIWRMIPGIRRAGIAVAVGTKDQHTVLVDVGANVHCKPIHLLHYGIMASIFAELALGHKNPKVALLNIGAEEAKGNPLVKETMQLLTKAPLNFIGSVEGNDIFDHRADVVVCEGFVGNVMLKVSEGLSATLHARFEDIVGKIVKTHPSPALAEAIADFRRATDYAEIGGAPLLGVNGTCLICHGRSDRRALGNAMKLAGRFVKANVVQTIQEGVAAHQEGES
ncbi:MAG: phosphate acyltransferase PlsX [Planctomycetota bacterium]